MTAGSGSGADGSGSAGSGSAGPVVLRGHYAGFVSRFVAFVVDTGTSTGIFMLVLAAVSFAFSVLAGHPVSWSMDDTAVVIAYAGWVFIYYAYSWGSNGKTFGMALLGVRVVTRDGGLAGVQRGIVRTLAFPLSFLLFGLGFAGILTGRERRALHDVIAGTSVVYTWDAYAARLRFLARDEVAPVPALAGPPAPETAVTRPAGDLPPGLLPDAARSVPGPAITWDRSGYAGAVAFLVAAGRRGRRCRCRLPAWRVACGRDVMLV